MSASMGFKNGIILLLVSWSLPKTVEITHPSVFKIVMIKDLGRHGGIIYEYMSDFDQVEEVLKHHFRNKPYSETSWGALNG
jgi:hypothetical protein